MARSLHFYTQLCMTIFITTLSIVSADAADEKVYQIGESLQKEQTVKALSNGK